MSQLQAGGNVFPQYDSVAYGVGRSWWSMAANPVDWGGTGDRSFCSDVSGVSRESAPGTVTSASPPIDELSEIPGSLTRRASSPSSSLCVSCVTGSHIRGCVFSNDSHYVDGLRSGIVRKLCCRRKGALRKPPFNTVL